MIGLMCATDKEFETVKKNIQCMQKKTVVGHEFYSGKFRGKEVVIVQTGIGKVEAAMVSAALNICYGCQRLIIVGTAGGL